MANKGTHLSEEVKAKIRKKLLGRRCCMRTEFAKGRVSWNKGIKGICKANSGSFKKGNIPANYMGGLKVCKDGIYIRIGKKTYNYGKLSVGKYENLARNRYREAFGKFPKNMIIFHKDGDIYNNEIENLELISRAELLKRNSYKIKKNCATCGKEFFAKTNYVKNCSKECIKQYNKLKVKEYSKTHRDKMNESQRRYKEKLKYR